MKDFKEHTTLVVCFTKIRRTFQFVKSFFVATPWNRTKLFRLMRPMGHLAPRPPFLPQNNFMINSYYPTVTYPRHALVVPAGAINIFKNLIWKRSPTNLRRFSQITKFVGLGFRDYYFIHLGVSLFKKTLVFWYVVKHFLGCSSFRTWTYKYTKKSEK